MSHVGRSAAPGQLLGEDPVQSAVGAVVSQLHLAIPCGCFLLFLCVYVFSFARDLHVPLLTVIICAHYSAHRKSLPHRIALPLCTNLTILLK